MTDHPFAPPMRKAIALAERGRWTAAPNPTVGAVLVHDGKVVAEGWHAAPGTPHAEVACLADATAKGVNPADCTMVVTLEPCNHHGKTPPCTEAIAAAGIRHLVTGLSDPNPQAAGGAARLREQGVTVEEGVLESECRDLAADFIVWQTTDRPYGILKLASTIDGRIATRTGHSQWISSEAARQEVHILRAGVGHAGGVVLVGSNTLMSDNPSLTARTDDVVRQPLAAAIASRLPGSDSLTILKDRPQETIIFTTSAGAASTRAAALRQRGVRILGLENWKSPTGEDLLQAMKYLRNEAGCLYVLCEGGGKIGLSLLESGLVDELHLFLSPRILGDNEANPLFDGRSPLQLDEGLQMRITHMDRIDTDCRLILRTGI